MTDQTEKIVEVMADVLRDWPHCYVHGPKGCAKSILTALTEAGYAVVPVEPTEAMLDEGTFHSVPWEYHDADTGEQITGPFALELSGPCKIERAGAVLRELWRAMLSASQKGGQAD